ncbi:hypothetical protein EVAR_79745_1 [Eumeta japonica]|uniref:Uncharacterized protein n=1 Tax=Eumeta variegata TaxID=151549 RepID=A0A4C1TCA8_EUMVA|nr:hypothetical protein EVAR_79745_1 [Eumeta japonica]
MRASPIFHATDDDALVDANEVEGSDTLSGSASGKCNTENPMMLNPLEYGWEQQDTSYVFKWFEGDQLPRLISDFIKDVSDDNEDDEQMTEMMNVITMEMIPTMKLMNYNRKTITK